MSNMLKFISDKSVGALMGIALLVISGCQTNNNVHIVPSLVFHDDVFPNYTKTIIETEAEIFEIGNDASQFVDRALNRTRNQDKRIKLLADSIFDHSNLALIYENSANTIAKDTFSNRRANCLSLVIMTYAMAQYAGLGVQFQQVETPELWERRDGNNILNGHVNLLLYPKTASNVILYEQRSYQLDFDPQNQRSHYPVRFIEKPRVLAMFYNNKAVDAMVNKDYSTAYAYLRKALSEEPSLGEGWTNLGVLYRRNGRIELAEESYAQALLVDANDTSALENMANIYNLTGRTELAAPILTLLETKRKNNPYYHFLLGETAYEQKRWADAIKHYRRSIRLDRYQHQFYFSLSKSYYHLGNLEMSEKYIKLAKKYADKNTSENLYQSKIDKFTSLH